MSLQKTASQTEINYHSFFLLTIIIIIGFALRAYVLPFRQVIEYDGVHWAMLGKNLLSGKGYTEPEGIFQWYYPPVYPINIGLIWLLIKNVELSGKIVSLIYGSLLPLVVYFLSKRLYGKRVAIISSVLVVLSTHLIDLSSAVIAESIYITLAMLVILIGHYVLNQDKSLPYFLLGSLLGILYLTKSPGILYFGIIFLWVIYYSIISNRPKLKTLNVSVLFLTGFLVISLPYILFLKNHFKHWTLSELTTINFYEGIKQDENDYPQKSYQLNADSTEMKFWTSSSYPGYHISIFENFKNNPQKFLKRFYRNIKTLSPFLIQGFLPLRALLIFLLFFGLINFNRNDDWVKKDFFLLTMLLPLFVFPLISARTTRHILPLIPILIILYANGAIRFQDWLCSLLKKYGFRKTSGVIKNALINNFLIIIIIMGMLIECGFYFSYLEKGRKGYDPIEYKKLGIWINDNLGSGLKIMSVTPHTAFYAKGIQVTLPWAKFPQVMKYARHKGVNYMVIGERYVPSQRPLLAFLLDEKFDTRDLKLTKEIEENGKKVLLYKLPVLQTSNTR